MNNLYLYFYENKKRLQNKSNNNTISNYYMKLKKIFIILISIIVFIVSTFFINVNNSKAATLEPEDNQKVEYRATELKETDNGNQLIVEIWIQNLNFKGMDLRLEYDENIVKPSNINTNEIIDVNEELTIPSCFEFVNGFGGYLDYFAMEMADNEYRGILSMVGSDDRTGTNEYLVEDDDIGDYVSINGEVQLATLSFNVGDSTTSDFTEQSLHLKEASTSPKTGIKVNANGSDSYENQKLFIFTLDLASDNAYLSNIESDSFTIDNFNKETFDYEVSITEIKDKITITPTKEDENAQITYNDEPIESGAPFEVTLNPIGENTVIQIVVTAEDGKKQNTYTITVKIAVGTITGKIQLGNGLRESMEGSYGVTTKYIADITLYKAGEFNWDGIIAGDTSLDELDTYEKVVSTKSDDEGNYSLYIPPGTYDCIIERKGFLAQIIKTIKIAEGEVIDLEERILIEGDADRSGIVDLDDTVVLVNFTGATLGDENYDEKYDYGQKGFIGLDDMVSTTSNLYNTISIEEYVKE